MRKVIVINPKGGCGKTTIATNLASYYAARGYPTALFDYDPQGSSSRWLQLRTGSYTNIHGVDAFRATHSGVTRSWHLRAPPGTTRIVIDTPASLHQTQLNDMIRDVDNIIIPVLPSSIDTFAAADFIRDLLLSAKVRTLNVQLVIVANRVRENTVAYRSLERFLSRLHIPIVTHLRDTQYYVHAFEHGIGIHEIESSRTHRDKGHWASILSQLESEHVQPPDRRSAEYK